MIDWEETSFFEIMRDMGQAPVTSRNISECKHEHWFRSRTCGVNICTNCDAHEGLVRCFCGWSASGRSGYAELLEMGEQIEDD